MTPPAFRRLWEETRMKPLVAYTELPAWVPGEMTLSGDGQGWRNVALRAWRYRGQDVTVPAMQDFLLVGYRRGVTPMRRRYDGRWRREVLGPGAVSLLTRAQKVAWNWEEEIDVTHVHLSVALVAEVASEMLDCTVAEVELADVLRAEDPAITAAMEMIAAEARSRALGGALYVESVSRGLIVHLLRRYAAIRTPAQPEAPGLSPAERRTIEDFIDANLSGPLDLKGMAAALGLTPCLFARRFRESFAMPPYAYVKAKRLERARRLLARSALPIKAVAADCGFSDQAHLTRNFANAFGATPAAFRRSAS